MENERKESAAATEKSADRTRFLSLVETLVPASVDGVGMPAASELPEFRDMAPEEVQLVYGPLLELLVAERSSSKGGEDFAALDLKAREAILRGLETQHPGVVRGAVLPTLIRYYGTDAVVRALGLEARPPHPGGYILEETDWSLLGPVSAMDAIYKATPFQGDES